jgi:AraC family transcriptional regulator of adaptative response / DNA-3-methyladenine glycosylase II
MLGWLGARAIAGVETVDGTTYRRVLGPGIVELEPRPDAGHVVARLEVDDVTTVSSVVARCRRLLDLDADPAAVDETLGVDPLLRRSVARRPGLRVPGTVDGFELAVRAVVGQQISVSGARTLLGRIVERCGAPLDPPRDGLTHAFPTAAALADADLAGVGLTGARVRTLRALASEVASGDLVLDPVADRAETRARLAAIEGVGPWTVDYVAMRALADPDAFPATDLVLRRRLGADATARAQRWRPWRAYAAMHVWTGAAEEMG